MLDMDDVTQVRVVPKCWNDSRRHGNMVSLLSKLHSDPFVKHWYYDAEGYKLRTLRYPMKENFRKMGLRETEVFIPPHYSCTSEG